VGTEEARRPSRPESLPRFAQLHRVEPVPHDDETAGLLPRLRAVEHDRFDEDKPAGRRPTTVAVGRLET